MPTRWTIGIDWDRDGARLVRPNAVVPEACSNVERGVVT